MKLKEEIDALNLKLKEEIDALNLKLKEEIDALLDKPEAFNKLLDLISRLDSLENQSTLRALVKDVSEYLKDILEKGELYRNKGLVDKFLKFLKIFKILHWKLVQEDNNKPNPISFEDILYAEEWENFKKAKENWPSYFKKANKRALYLVMAANSFFNRSAIGACIYLAFMYNAAAHDPSCKSKQEYMKSKEFYIDFLLRKIGLCLDDNKGEFRYGYACDNKSTVRYVYYFEYKGIQISFHCTFPPPSNCFIPEWHSEEWDHIQHHGIFPWQLEWFDL